MAPQKLLVITDEAKLRQEVIARELAKNRVKTMVSAGHVVHFVVPDICGNCGHKKDTHLNGACLFEFTQYRQETLHDHEDCSCDDVVEGEPW